MRLTRHVLAIVFLAGLAAGSTFASLAVAAPAKQEPQRLRWKSPVIRIAISGSLSQPNPNIKTGTDVVATIERSLQTWQSAADVEFQVEATDRRNVSPAGVAGDGVSLITIAATAENVLLFTKNPFSEAARTRVFYNRSGYITEADIVLNPFQQFSTDGTMGTFDLESTLTHEIGHLLGLRHSGVLGATMSESFSKNGLFGFVDMSARTLAGTDVAAIRELYGREREENCCGAITGRLSLQSGRGASGARVWAEERETGLVAAQALTAADGSFRLGGLGTGDYNVFWQKRNVASLSSGELATTRVERGETSLLNEKITLRRNAPLIDYAGINGQLAESAVGLKPGGEYLLYLGGLGLDDSKMNISFRSPFLTVDPTTIGVQNFGDGITAMSFIIKISEDTPRGTYSVFVAKPDGSQAALIGAIDVQ